MSESSVVDEDDLTRPSDLDYKLRPRPIDVNQKLNIVFPDDEDIDEADELFETPIKVSIDYFERKKPKNIPIPVFKELEHPTYKMKPFVRPKNYIVYQGAASHSVFRSTFPVLVNNVVLYFCS
jgi:hypothetical protein